MISYDGASDRAMIILSRPVEVVSMVRVHLTLPNVTRLRLCQRRSPRNHDDVFYDVISVMFYTDRDELVPSFITYVNIPHTWTTEQYAAAVLQTVEVNVNNEPLLLIENQVDHNSDERRSWVTMNAIP